MAYRNGPLTVRRRPALRSTASPYLTDLPPLSGPEQPISLARRVGGSVATPGIGRGIPAVVLAAYRKAEEGLHRTRPGCHLRWQLLAAIGQVESGQANGGKVDATGTTLTPILGPVLDGTNGYANIPASDGGKWTGDPVHERAVGPMQFIPSTWATWGADGNGDGVRDPNNVFDAALAAGDYLCAISGDLSVPGRLDRAILGYNRSHEYLDTVMSWFAYFLQGGAVEFRRPPSRASAPSASTPAGGRPHSPPPTTQTTVHASGTAGPDPHTSGTPSPSGSPSPGPSVSGSQGTSPSPASSCFSPSPSTSCLLLCVLPPCVH